MRLKRDSLAELEAVKTKLEKVDDGQREVRELASSMRFTVLAPEQLRDAEAAFRMLEGRRHSLLQCVSAARSILGEGGTKDCAQAFEDWQADQRRMHLSEVTLKNNRGTVKLFLAAFPVKTLDDIAPAMIEKFIFENDLMPFSQIQRLRQIRAWLNFCVSKKWLGRNPCEVDAAKMVDAAKRNEVREDRIISPEQSERLLQAAVNLNGGIFVPYVILSLFCFMRSAEVRRIQGKAIHLDIRNPSIDVWGHKKGGKFRSVTIPANVRPLLQDCFDRGLIDPEKPVHFDFFGWRKVREAAGLIETQGFARSRIINSEWQPNLLRHTGVTYLYALTGDITQTTRQAGHSESTAFAHYLQLATPEQAAKFYAIDVRLPAEQEQIAEAV